MTICEFLNNGLFTFNNFCVQNILFPPKKIMKSDPLNLTLPFKSGIVVKTNRKHLFD